MTETAEQTRRGGWALDLALALLSFCAAWWIGAPALDGGLVSDDLAFPSLCTDDAGEPRWERIADDLGEGWLGGDAPLFRPLVTASLVTDLARADSTGDPAAIERSLHETNLLLHGLTAALTALLVAASLRVLGRGDASRWAGLAAGLAFALHPIAVEPISWIAARNSSQEVLFRTAALLCWVRFLGSGNRRWILAAAGASAFALGTKETAAVLPALFLVFDLWLGRDRPTHWKERIVDLFRVSPPFLIYALWRVALFGTDQTPGGEGGDALAHLGQRFTLIGAPGLDDQELGWPVWLPLFALVALLATGRRPLHLLVGGLTMALATAPTLGLPSPSQVTGHRTAYGLLVLALPFVAASITGVALDRARRGSVLAAMAILLGALGWMSRQGLERYDEAWNRLAAARSAIAALDVEACAISAMPEMPAGVPPFNQNNWFLPFRPPLDSDGIVVFGLGHQYVEVPGAESLLGDVTAMRTVLAAGLPILGWDGEQFVRMDRANRPQLPAEIPVPFAEGRFAFPVPADPFAFEAVRLGFDRQVEGGTVRIDPAPDASLPPETWVIGFGPSDADGTVVVDLRSNLILAALSTFGIPIRGLVVETDDPGAPPMLTLLPTLPEPAWPDPKPEPENENQQDLASFAIDLPSLDPERTMRIWVLSPHSALAWDAMSGSRSELPDRWKRELPFWLEMAGPGSELGWFAETVEGAPMRTTLRRSRFR